MSANIMDENEKKLAERGLPPSQIQKWSEQIFGKKEDAE